MAIANLWFPVYTYSTTVRSICAAASIPTAIIVARGIPAIAEGIRHFGDRLSDAQKQRDLAEDRLIVSEKLVATELKAKNDLTFAYKRLDEVLEATSDCIMTVGFDWTILFGNRKTVETIPDFSLHKNYWSCFPGVVSTPIEEDLRKTMDERLETENEVFYPPYKKWFRLRTFPSLEGISLVFSDTTEEKNLQAELILEQKMREKRIEALSHMAGGLAHEISNPLAIIHARASDLLYVAESESPVPSLVVRTACESIVKTSDRAMRILRGLKGFGREAPNDPKEFASLYEIVDQCVEMQQSRFDRHRIELRIALHPDIPFLLCRETQIGQILNNLLNNAFDAVVHTVYLERWVSLTALCSDTEIIIDVSDSGPGIPDADKAHLMEPFFTTKEVGKGTGIGLSLSRAIANEHGGSLILRKDTAHTCFRLGLPIAPQAQQTIYAAVGDAA